MTDKPDQHSKSTSSNQDHKTGFEDIFSGVVERIARLDSQGLFLSVNKQFAGLFGYQPEAMIGMSLQQLCSAEEADKAKQLFHEAKCKGRIEEQLQTRTKQGDLLSVHIVLTKGIGKSKGVNLFYCFIDLIEPEQTFFQVNEASLYEAQLLEQGLEQNVPLKEANEDETYRDLIENLNAIFWECSFPGFQFNFISPSVDGILGFSPEEWLSDNNFWAEHVHPDELDEIVNSCMSSSESGQDHELIYRFRNKEEKYVWLHDIVRVVFDDNHKPYKLRGVMVDISDKKKAELALVKSNENIQQAFDLCPDAIYEGRLSDGVITKVNEGFLRLTGFSKEEVLGSTTYDLNIISKEYRQALADKIKETGRVSNIEVNYRRKDGSYSTALVSAVVTYDNEEAYVFSIVRDIAERKFTEELLRSSEEKIRLISDSIPITISYLDTDLCFQFANKQYQKNFNITNAEIMGKPYEEIIGENAFNSIKHFLTPALSGNAVTFEYEDIRTEPSKVYEVSLIPNLDSSGEVRGLYVLSDDITEKKHSKLRELRLGKILEDSLNEIYIMDADSLCFTFANRGARENLGYSMEELQHLTPLDITADYTKEELEEFFAPLYNGSMEQVKTQTKHRRKDGSTYDVEVSLQLFNIGNIRQFVAMVEDVTNRKTAEEKLLRSEEIISASNDAIAYIDKNNSYIYANKQYCDLIGNGVETLQSLKVRDVLGDEVFKVIEPLFDRTFKGEVVRSQRWMDLPKGSRYLDVQYNPSFNENEEVVGVVVSIRDITEHEQAKQALFESEERFRLITLSTNDALYDWDLVENKVWRNDQDFTNYFDPNARKEWYSIIHPDDQEYIKKSFSDAVLKTENHWSEEYRVRLIDGTYTEVLDKAYILYDEDNKPSRVMGAMSNISERKKAEVALRSSEERFRTLYEDNPLMLFTLDSNGIILSMNNHVSYQLGYGDMLLLDEPIYSLIKPVYLEEIEKALSDCLVDKEKIQRIEFEIRHKWQGEVWVRSTIRAIQDGSGVDRILMVCEDISETKRLSQQLSYQASHDALTGLVNRAEFERRLERILHSYDSESCHALCYLDLDQFKIVNDTCGHLAGDELLRQVSGILKEAVRKRDTLARLGGDEFGILMEHCTLDQAQRVANTMRKSIEEFRFVWEGNRFILGASIGLVPIETINQNINDVLRDADVACYAAKEAGRNRVHIYSPEDSQLSDLHGQVKWAAMINHALDEDRFHLYQQKIQSISVDGKEEEKFEILLRMESEQGKLIGPGAFMPAAERYNLAVKIDTWVFDRVLEWMQSNPERINSLSMCSINLSGQTIDNERYLEFVLQRLYESAISPEKICFEITETAAISNISMAIKFIKALREVGCSFALDDFGSGVSSFGYLKQLPVDYLKIDGTFVRDIADDPIDFEMVRSIHDIGQVMGLRTIAEFVEDDAIKDKLHEIGVDYGQGYGIAKPAPLT